MKRKAVRMWAVWWPEESKPVALGWTRAHALRVRKERYGAFQHYMKVVDVVAVEVRPVPAKPRKKARKK